MTTEEMMQLDNLISAYFTGRHILRDDRVIYGMANLLKEAGVQDAYNREWQLHVESLSMDSEAICIVQDVL